MDVDLATLSKALPIETKANRQCHHLGSDEGIRASSHFPVIVKEEEKLMKINNDDDNNTNSSPSQESQLHSVSPHITSPPYCPAQGRFALTHTENTPKNRGNDIKKEMPGERDACSWRPSAGANVLVCE